MTGFGHTLPVFNGALWSINLSYYVPYKQLMDHWGLKALALKVQACADAVLGMCSWFRRWMYTYIFSTIFFVYFSCVTRRPPFFSPAPPSPFNCNYLFSCLVKCTRTLPHCVYTRPRVHILISILKYPRAFQDKPSIDVALRFVFHFTLDM